MSAGRYLPPEEQHRLLAELHAPRDRLLAVLALHTGFRVSELLSLRWRDLVDEAGRPLPAVAIDRRNLKGGRSAKRKGIRGRRLPLNAAAAAAISEYVVQLGPALSREEWVFASRKKSPGVLSRRQAHTIVASAAARAGLSGPVGPHGCRRSFAIGVYQMTKDLLAVQLLLGHADPLTTATYLRWGREQELENIVLRLADAAISSPGAVPPPAREVQPA